MVDVVHHQPLGRDQPARVPVAEFVGKQQVIGVREAVDLAPVGRPGTQLVLEVDRDDVRVALGDEIPEALEAVVVLRQRAADRLLDPDRGRHDVVGAALFDVPVVRLAPAALGGAPPPSEDGPLDPVAAAVREHEDAGGAAEFVDAEGIGNRLPHDVDPHVDAALPHDLREHEIELVAADLPVRRFIGRAELVRLDHERRAVVVPVRDDHRDPVLGIVEDSKEDRLAFPQRVGRVQRPLVPDLFQTARQVLRPDHRRVDPVDVLGGHAAVVAGLVVVGVPGALRVLVRRSVEGAATGYVHRVGQGGSRLRPEHVRVGHAVAVVGDHVPDLFQGRVEHAAGPGVEFGLLVVEALAPGRVGPVHVLGFLLGPGHDDRAARVQHRLVDLRVVDLAVLVVVEELGEDACRVQELVVAGRVRGVDRHAVDHHLLDPGDVGRRLAGVGHAGAGSQDRATHESWQNDSRAPLRDASLAGQKTRATAGENAGAPSDFHGSSSWPPQCGELKEPGVRAGRRLRSVPRRTARVRGRRPRCSR